jgi:hypothetical protein
MRISFRHSGLPLISGLPEISNRKTKSATADLVGGKSGIHIHNRLRLAPLRKI